MPQRSLAGRALMALFLTIGFYALAIAIAGGLLLGVYLEVVYANRLEIRLSIFAIVMAFVILWSILPRVDRFVAPGPMLEETRCPKLFGVIRAVASKTEQTMPSEVYLVPEVNAWVAQRKGFIGIGSRRVMGIGLPLLETVTIPQFMAIIAHEFGHYYHGDTRLGPWIYRTRQAIVRTVKNLARSQVSALYKPFLWYGNFFMRVTQSISRSQEIAADELAARVAGSRNAIEALLATHRVAAAYDEYWVTEVVPILANGFRPPIAAGLTEFMRSAEIDRQLGHIVAREIVEGKADAYDSHPPLRERIAALKTLDPGENADSAQHASTLIDDLDAAEESLLRALFGNTKEAENLRPIEWMEAAKQVYAPVWRRRATEQAAVLRDLTLGGVPDNLQSFAQLAVRMNFVNMPQEEALASAQSVIACALAVLLLDQGWLCDTAPGKAVRMTQNDRFVDPFVLIVQRVRGEVAADVWSAACDAIGEHPLA